jgi:acyl-CoA reductase-like NAD-dependent aldehyde dehydrogenase
MATATVTLNNHTSSLSGLPDLDFNGNFVQIIDGKSSPTAQVRHGLNPANLEPKAEVPLATKEDLDKAVEKAKAAFKTWSQVPYEERRAAVLAYADAVEKYHDEFRGLLISEQGKPVCPVDHNNSVTHETSSHCFRLTNSALRIDSSGVI